MQGRLQERDLAEMAVLDTHSWRFAPPQLEGEGGPPHLPPPPRGGATLNLLPCEGGLCLLLLGGREFVPPPPSVSWPAGQHLGREDAHLFWLGKLGPVPDAPPSPEPRLVAPSSAPAGLRDVRSPP